MDKLKLALIAVAVFAAGELNMRRKNNKLLPSLLRKEEVENHSKGFRDGYEFATNDYSTMYWSLKRFNEKHDLTHMPN